MAINNEGSLKLIQFLLGVKKRPQLFLNKKSLKRLGWVEMGFMFGDNNLNSSSDLNFFANECKNSIWNDFSSYICQRYNITTPNYTELVNYCQSDEKAFDLFFEELEMFLKKHNIDIPEVD